MTYTLTEEQRAAALAKSEASFQAVVDGILSLYDALEDQPDVLKELYALHTTMDGYQAIAYRIQQDKLRTKQV
jgi:hypothetical protein